MVPAGCNMVLLYASKYKDIRSVVDISGRFNLAKGKAHHLGKITYNVTEESLMDCLNTIIHLACLSIPEIAGKGVDSSESMDKTIPAEDALEFAKSISNHELRIIEGAGIEYTCHQDELTSFVVQFIKVNNDKENNTSKQTQFGRVDKPFHSRF
ncbi:putative alpha/Beta hydrolase [Medicago truncatula]|uniref:Putative alpha/Beta hydrolase n=1 Tax=Medicago truncatula TaxID=3880 RepID=A0A396JIJ6_MEDTR|nr:putative alpha/Beta hydrolase [Medicago truncatula]